MTTTTTARRSLFVLLLLTLVVTGTRMHNNDDVNNDGRVDNSANLEHTDDAVVAVTVDGDGGAVDNTPCLQTTWRRDTGECTMVNACANVTLVGTLLCDHAVMLCGSSTRAMCGGARFVPPDGRRCFEACQGLEWFRRSDEQCNATGTCCAPRTEC